MSLRQSLLLLGVLATMAGAIHGWSHRATPSVLPDAVPSHSGESALAPSSFTEKTGPSVPATVSDLTLALNTTSLANLSIPQSLTVDANGDLIVDEGTRELMDFFLALDGELDDASIRTLFSTAAHTQCSPACATAAVALFDRYRDYLLQMQELQQDWMTMDDLRSRLDAVTELRHQILGNELSEALFGYEEQYDALRIQQWEIRQDDRLTDQEKQGQLEALTYSGPAGLQEREQANLPWQQLHQWSQQTQTQDAASLYQSRQQLVGAAAADRLAQLDNSRVHWEQRYHHYRAEADRLTTAALAKEDQSQQLDDLRNQYFTPQEIMRVAALDRIRTNNKR